MADANIQQTKVCTKCGAAKPLSEYGKLATSRTGLSPRCKACERRRGMEWHHSNKDRANANARAWKAKNRERVSEYNKRYAEQDQAKSERFSRWSRANEERRREYQREWNKANPERVSEHNRRRLAIPSHRINNAIRCRIWSSLGGKKWGRTFDLLGYGLEDLMRHIERQFTNKMDWTNYGEWHIDHIIPLSSFDYTSTDDPDFRAAWALTNLRPVWARENLRKGAKRLTLL